MIFAAYPKLRVAVVGDFCLDRYLEIDPRKKETSIETGLPVHNVVNVRAQPGGAGTVLNNLAALGIGEIFPIGFCGDDAEGFELRRTMATLPSVKMTCFFTSADRRTFTYCKPLLIKETTPPVELSRLDTKNWSPTPAKLQRQLAAGIRVAAQKCDVIVVLDQVDITGTGVITDSTRRALAQFCRTRLMLVDSRRNAKSFAGFPLKLNRSELAGVVGRKSLNRAQVKSFATALARRYGQNIFVTLAEEGMIAADANGTVSECPACPVRGPIDIVGAGDAVTANLAAALAAGATIPQALKIASAAASIVIHQLGTTGVATVQQIIQIDAVSKHQR